MPGFRQPVQCRFDSRRERKRLYLEKRKKGYDGRGKCQNNKNRKNGMMNIIMNAGSSSKYMNAV